MGPCEPGPLGEVAGLRRSVEAEEAAHGLARGRRPARLGLRVAALGVEPDARLHRGVAPQHRSDVVAPAAPAPGHQVGVRRAVSAPRAARSCRASGPSPAPPSWPSPPPPAPRSGRTPSRRRVAGPAGRAVRQARRRRGRSGHARRARGHRARARGWPADDVGDDEVTGVDRPAVGLPGDALGPRRQRQQRRVGGEVRGGAGRRFGKTACAPDGQPGAGQPEGENLIGVHWDAVLQGAHWVKSPIRRKARVG